MAKKKAKVNLIEGGADKSIDQILREIQKKHGKTSIRRIEDVQTSDKLEVISTGSMWIDEALGIGGLPRGRIVEIYGPEASGKCLTADTFCLTTEGIMTIWEIFSSRGIDLARNPCAIESKDLTFLNRDGAPEACSALTVNGVKPVYKISTRSGSSIKATSNHPLLVISGDKTEWKETSKISIGDNLCCLSSPSVSIGKIQLDDNASYIHGFSTAKLYTDKDEAIVRMIREYDKNLILQPLRIMRYESAKHCLRGFFDFHLFLHEENVLIRERFGDIKYKNGLENIKLFSKYKHALYQVKLVLQHFFGIFSTLSVATEKNDYYSLELTGDNCARYVQKIGSNYRDAFQNTHPYTDEPDFFTDEVVAIEAAGEEPTFDFSLGQTHSFATNGVISHNTTVTLHCIAEAQRRGGNALFIDAEHSLDLSLAKKVGVDTKNLVFSQPDSGEQGLNILEMGISSGKFSIAVVDSVSALVPEAELNGEMADNHMGVQARLMGRALRKLVPLVGATNTLLIFINQIRMKIGILFGNPETTSGGQALKFLASVRMCIRRNKLLKKGEKAIGNLVTVEIVKNKLAAPYKKIETELIFGHGFCKEAELIKLASDMDIIDVQKTKYYHQGKMLGKGKDEVIATLQANPKMFRRILDDVRVSRQP
jgi:recombination protein RecA